MKLATLRDGTRDGRLIVVSNDNKRFLQPEEYRTLQSALDSGDEGLYKLNEVYDRLLGNPDVGESLEFSNLRSPLPRAFEWVDGSAYINHIVLVRKARGAEPPATLREDPLVYQGGSGCFLDPQQEIPIVNEAWGLDFESEVCVVLGDTPQGVKAADAGKYIKLVMICNDVTFRNLIPNELQKGFGFFNSKPATAFAPICVTPDELGDFWKEGRLHLPLETKLNGKLYGNPDAGSEMHFSFHELVEHICKTRSFTAGTILGSGTVSNEDRDRGSSCLAEQRMIEKIDTGEFVTPFLKKGDSVEIAMRMPNGTSVFGSIEQVVG